MSTESNVFSVTPGTYDLSPASVRNAEVAFYIKKLNVYGLPLDSRADYTKLDWSIWTATLAFQAGGVQSNDGAYRQMD